MISLAVAEGGEEEEEEEEEYETSNIPLDDNGFPSFQLLSSDPQPLGQNNASSIKNQPSQPHHQGEGDSFASDFYRCGTDCSSLLLLQNHHDDTNRDGTDYVNPRNGNPNSERKLKQANLFQMWGMEKKPHLPLPNSQPLLKKMKVGNGESHFTKRTKTSTFTSPRLCPFYKKIPGEFCFSFYNSIF
jgi:DNA cross-link repair 1A protein